MIFYIFYAWVASIVAAMGATIFAAHYTFKDKLVPAGRWIKLAFLSLIVMYILTGISIILILGVK